MMNCTKLSYAELEVTFFGQGKHQQNAAIKLCSGCPFTKQCETIAEEMVVMKDGKVMDGAWGVFGGKAYRAGKVVR